MLTKLKKMLREIEEAIEYAELSDVTYTKFYRELLRERKALRRAVKVFEKSGR